MKAIFVGVNRGIWIKIAERLIEKNEYRLLAGRCNKVWKSWNIVCNI